jgi:hypothetical protein
VLRPERYRGEATDWIGSFFSSTSFVALAQATIADIARAVMSVSRACGECAPDEVLVRVQYDVGIIHRIHSRDPNETPPQGKCLIRLRLYMQRIMCVSSRRSNTWMWPMLAAAANRRILPRLQGGVSGAIC